MSETATITADAPVDTLLARADLLLLLSTLLRPPGVIAADQLDIRRDDLAELLITAGVHTADLEAGLADTLAAFGTCDRQAWSDEYHRLFESTLACPPNETAYVRRDKGAVLADVAAFYRAFGFSTSRHAGEKLDHIVAEIEFVAMATVMLALARRDADDTKARTTAEALQSFVTDHLNVWLLSFARRLASVTALPHYLQLAVALESACRALAQQQRWPEPSESVEPPDDDHGTPYQCGMAQPDVELRVAGQVQPPTPSP
jgi:TorA maturation chaperone TorD